MNQFPVTRPQPRLAPILGTDSAQKSVAWMGAGRGWGRVGTSCNHYRPVGVTGYLYEDTCGPVFFLPRFWCEKQEEILSIFLYELFRPFFCENFLQGFDFTLFPLRTGENAAHFSARIFTVFWSLNFLLIQGKMLPIFLQELFPAFRLFNFSVQKWGKCCTFFGENCCRALIVQFSCRKTGEMLPIFLREFFAGLWFYNFLAKAGENAAHFSARIFYSVLISEFSVNDRGKCCPFFCKNFLQHFDCSISQLKMGKMLPIFRRELFQGFEITFFLIKTGGKAAHFSANFWQCFDLSNFCKWQGKMLPNFLQELFTAFLFKKWGKTAHFFCENVLQCFDFTIFLLKAREMLPILLWEMFMLPIFLSFAVMLILQYFCLKLGELLAVCLRELLQHFDCSHFL